jgi:hypothetical protein
MEASNEQPPEQTYEDRIRKVREGLLQEMEAYEFDGAQIDAPDTAREVGATAQALEQIDRILHRIERSRPQPAPPADLVAPTEGTLRTAIWMAVDNVGGLTSQQADAITDGTIKILRGEA